MKMAGFLSNFNESAMNSTVLKCKPTERHLNAAAKGMIALLSLFCILALLGSSVPAVKYFKKIIEESNNTFYAGETHINSQFDDDKNNTLHVQNTADAEFVCQDGIAVTTKDSLLSKLEMFVACFCVFTNGAKLLNASSSEGDLLCIYGVRFLSMSWVILGHTYGFVDLQIKNMVETIPTLDTFPFQAVLQANYSVDSFFVLSGFLLTFLSMKEFSKTNGKISWPHFYIHRYVRLTPMYMVLLGFSATLYLYLGSGPYWPDGDYDPACKKTWWKNLLYINNFNLEAGQCLRWSWYLANDMQFFIISPLFLIALWRWPKIGCSLLAVFVLISCLCNFFITYHFDLYHGVIEFLHNGIDNFAQVEKRNAETFDKLYTKPYTRIGSYAVGMLTGFLFFKRKTSKAPKHSLLFLTVGWIIACSVTLPVVYGMYHSYPGLIHRSFHNAFSRICFASGLSWVIYVCLMGQGGFINSILSFKPFLPLSRLTYAAYLLHPMIILGYLNNLKSSFAFSHTVLVMLFLGFMVVTYALSVPVSLFFESPIVALEKLVLKKFTAKQKREIVK